MMETLGVLLRRKSNTGERLMSLRPIRLAAGLLVTSLVFGAAPLAPALADGIVVPPPRYHAPRYVRHHVRYVPRVRTVYRTVPRIVYVPQPVPQYHNPCGGCGSPAVYAPPVQYYNSSCGGCGYGGISTGYSSGYVGAVGYDDYEPQYAPAYSGYYGGYSTGYYGGGYVGGRFGYSRRFVGTRVGFRGGFSNRSFYGRRAGFR
jgi:hypothetical protein